MIVKLTVLDETSALPRRAAAVGRGAGIAGIFLDCCIIRPHLFRRRISFGGRMSLSMDRREFLGAAVGVGAAYVGAGVAGAAFSPPTAALAEGGGGAIK